MIKPTLYLRNERNKSSKFKSIYRRCFQVLLTMTIVSFIFSGMTAVSVYLFTKEIWSAGAGLFAACFIAIGEF